MLTIERRFKDILTVIQSIKTIGDTEYKLLNPVLKIYPEECIAFIQKYIDSKLKSAANRKVYAGLTIWLLTAHQITQPKKVMALINHVKTKYARLSALQDEMQKAGAYDYTVTQDN